MNLLLERVVVDRGLPITGNMPVRDDLTCRCRPLSGVGAASWHVSPTTGADGIGDRAP